MAIVSYDGGNYYGFQRLKDKPNIQTTIEKAIKNMTAKPIPIFVSGRTDRGVHAKGQVIHFDTDIDLADDVWVDGINRRLPEDIRIIKVKKASKNFHSRHSSKSKVYEYKIAKKPSTAFNSRFEVYKPNLDVSKMIDAAKLLEGTHDFAGFSIYIKDKPTEKTIYSVQIKETKNHIIIRFHGNSFLRYMVRRMVGLLIEIGAEKKEINSVTEVFETKNKLIANKTAPAKGLYLVKVFY